MVATTKQAPSVWYVDTSIAVYVLAKDPAAVAWFKTAVESAASEVVSSRLLQTDLTRVLRRESKPVVDRLWVLDYLELLEIDESVLLRAEMIGEPIKTLDAIHLATALAFGSSAVVVTHDRNMKAVAAAIGLATFDPLDPTDPG